VVDENFVVYEPDAGAHTPGRTANVALEQPFRSPAAPLVAHRRARRTTSRPTAHEFHGECRTVGRWRIRPGVTVCEQYDRAVGQRLEFDPSLQPESASRSHRSLCPPLRYMPKMI